jgi:hypothetical protein
MDRDKSSGKEPVNATKQRIADELSKKEGVAWITAGREIENYIEPALLRQCLSDSPNATALKRSPGPFEDALAIDNNMGSRPIDKVKLSRLVAAQPANYDTLDLKERIATLVNFIRRANHLPLWAEGRAVPDKKA